MNRCKRYLQVLTLSALSFGFGTILAGRIPTASAQELRPRAVPRAVATPFGMQFLSPGQTVHIIAVNPSEVVPCIRVRLTFDL